MEGKESGALCVSLISQKNNSDSMHKFGQTCLECMAGIAVNNQEKRSACEGNKVSRVEVI